MPDALTRDQRTDRFDLRALYETSQLLSASLDLEFVLNNLLLTAMSKLLVLRGMALLFDPLRDSYTVATSKGLAGLRAGDVFEMPHLDANDILHGESIPEVLRERRIELVLNVASGHKHIGLIALGAKATRQAFDERELEFIQSLVNMSSSAVYNSIMVEELRQANRDLDGKIQQLNTLFDLSQEFNATVDRSRLVKIFSFALMGQMLVQKHLFILGGNGSALVGDDGEPTYQVVSRKGLKDEPLERELIDAFCQRERLLLLEPDDEVPEGWEGFARRGLVLAIPLRNKEVTCGMLCLGPKMTGHKYEPDDLEFLMALANLAFVSLQNSFLVEQQIEKERLEEEMRLARTIQERLLPQELPAFDGIDIAALAIPSRQVGGDYYDHIKLDDNRLLVAIADVTGKGVPASLLMSNLQASLHMVVPMDLSLEDVAANINRVICQNTSYDKFITYFHGIYHADTGLFEYVNAGHNPPTLVRTDGSQELLETGGLLLGVMKGMPYERGRITLEPGDVLALFTDGVTEAMSPDGEEYHEDRLEPLLKEQRHGSAQEILDAVHQDIQRFTDYAPTLSDDFTMIVMKRA